MTGIRNYGIRNVDQQRVNVIMLWSSAAKRWATANGYHYSATLITGRFWVESWVKPI